MRRTNVELIISAISALGEATTGEIIGYIRDHGCKPPPPRVVSQICSCLPIVEKRGMRGAYVIWGKKEGFDEKVKKKTR
ncbi:unnamed protein product [marine sediment metagenome]|uniref:HTH HARE-type domain-containing protein n=1 Tax=marine sediment metagenome TaxID=412755 RepID=X1H4I6_9ZZZZ